MDVSLVSSTKFVWVIAKAGRSHNFRQFQDVFCRSIIRLFCCGRQIAKTTLLQDVQNQSPSHVTLDDLNMRLATQQDPASFVDRLELPVPIDEVQYEPNLFPYIKMVVDTKKQKGLF